MRFSILQVASAGFHRLKIPRGGRLGDKNPSGRRVPHVGPLMFACSELLKKDNSAMIETKVMGRRAAAAAIKTKKCWGSTTSTGNTMVPLNDPGERDASGEQRRNGTQTGRAVARRD